jgi:hypothetical protein
MLQLEWSLPSLVIIRWMVRSLGLKLTGYACDLPMRKRKKIYLKECVLQCLCAIGKLMYLLLLLNEVFL